MNRCKKEFCPQNFGLFFYKTNFRPRKLKLRPPQNRFSALKIGNEDIWVMFFTWKTWKCAGCRNLRGRKFQVTPSTSRILPPKFRFAISNWGFSQESKQQDYQWINHMLFISRDMTWNIFCFETHDSSNLPISHVFFCSFFGASKRLAWASLRCFIRAGLACFSHSWPEYLSV